LSNSRIREYIGSPVALARFRMLYRGLLAKGAYAMGLGILAVLIGLGAAGAGAYLGFVANGMPVALPGALAGASPETVAIVMLVSGAITMVLGAVSIVRSDHY
jgi:hypothetical protein